MFLEKIQDPALIGILIAGKYEEIYPPVLSSYINLYEKLMETDQSERSSYKWCNCEVQNVHKKNCYYHRTELERIDKEMAKLKTDLSLIESNYKPKQKMIEASPKEKK